MIDVGLEVRRSGLDMNMEFASIERFTARKCP
jgi:hypothetical protein